MQQLSMFDLMMPAPPLPVPKAAPVKKEKLSAWEIERRALRAARFAYREGLPADDEGLILQARKEIEAYDAAVRSADYDGMVRHGGHLKAIGEHAFGMTREEADKGGPPDGNERFFCLYDAWRWVADQTVVDDGVIPMFGQKGRFIIEISGCVIDFTYDGLFGICGGAARVVHLDRPFISETGYRSFQVCPDDFVIAAPNMNVVAWLQRICTAQLTEGGKKKLKLTSGPFHTEYHRDENGRVIREERTNKWLIKNREKDRAYQSGGYLHDIALAGAA